MEAFIGKWVRRGLISVPMPPEETPRKVGHPRRDTFFDWDRPAVLKAHADFVAGDRGLQAREGERLYQRERKRIQRARMSRTDLAWAEKNAVEWSWKPIFNGSVTITN